MDAEEGPTQAQWDEHGFAILSGLLTSEDLAPGLSEPGLLFPSAHEFTAASTRRNMLGTSVTNTEAWSHFHSRVSSCASSPSIPTWSTWPGLSSGPRMFASIRLKHGRSSPGPVTTSKSITGTS